MMLPTEYTVLDHGFVRLVDHMGNDDAVVQAARVSYGEGTKTKREDDKLIAYLAEHKHMTPFEHITLKVHVKLPIFVERQWRTHRTGSFNEISARYSQLKGEFYVPELDQIRAQSTTDRQSRGDHLIAPRLEAQAVIEMAYKGAYDRYLSLLGMGVARELARMVLPVGIYTEFYWTVNFRNLMHFLELRLDSHAQYEIREYAIALRDIAHSVAPVSTAAFLP